MSHMLLLSRMFPLQAPSASFSGALPAEQLCIHLFHVGKHGQCCWPQANSVAYLCRTFFLRFIVTFGPRFLTQFTEASLEQTRTQKLPWWIRHMVHLAQHPISNREKPSCSQGSVCEDCVFRGNLHEAFDLLNVSSSSSWSTRLS